GVRRRSVIGGAGGGGMSGLVMRLWSSGASEGRRRARFTAYQGSTSRMISAAGGTIRSSSLVTTYEPTHASGSPGSCLIVEWRSDEYREQRRQGETGVNMHPLCRARELAASRLNVTEVPSPPSFGVCCLDR